MASRHGVLVFVGWLLSAAVWAQTGAPVIAKVFGAEVRCAQRSPERCAAALFERAREQAARRFIAGHALSATEAELRRLNDYNREFERHDRSQRARKLAELDARLADPALVPEERTRLTRFRDVLERLARYEADVDAGREQREPIAEDTLRDWIEAAKLQAALYRRYGGVVGIAAHGPYAHGALRALIGEHLLQGDIEIYDPAVAAELQKALRAPPRIAHDPTPPDFTPFWERPIPASYFGQ
jgi:hypothetical protein